MIILRVLRFKTLKFQPRVVTSLRPHGKWGDLLVCLIPTVWCINILINSNFLLRLIEWQSESSLFTVRIRGKQWYWIYKFDIKDVGDIMSASKNVGFNKWYFSTNGSLDIIDDYLKIIQVRSTNLFFKKYWKETLSKVMGVNQDHLASPYSLVNSKDVLFCKNILNITDNSALSSSLYNVNAKKKNFTLFDELQRWVRRSFGITEPSKFFKKSLINENDLFGVRFPQNDNSILNKPSTNNPYLVIKQKRYALKKKIIPKILRTHLNANWGGETQQVKSNFFIQNSVGENTVEDLSRTYRFFKKNKMRDEMFNVATSKRMLRTQRTLVLPAHVNITAITNSYDVVHSWFIPGLGLKLDCIPGRATHHTFYADNVGFYYGQCAEICGRYHHHMPIRLCVLPYEQFLLWWHHFGLPKLLYSRNNKQYVNSVYFRKYVW